MNILCDRHHADLLYSLQKLFEDRLGFRLYVPVGSRLVGAGVLAVWTMLGDDRLARQFLYTNDSYRELESGLYLTFSISAIPSVPCTVLRLKKRRPCNGI